MCVRSCVCVGGCALSQNLELEPRNPGRSSQTYFSFLPPHTNTVQMGQELEYIYRQHGKYTI